MTKIKRSIDSQECHNKYFKRLNRSYFKKKTIEQMDVFACNK
jgi:hypothetical protein